MINDSNMAHTHPAGSGRDVTIKSAAVRAQLTISHVGTSRAWGGSAQPIRTAAETSVSNIAEWSSYLPADCVAMMVQLGWDRQA